MHLPESAPMLLRLPLPVLALATLALWPWWTELFHTWQQPKFLHAPLVAGLSAWMIHYQIRTNPPEATQPVPNKAALLSIFFLTTSSLVILLLDHRFLAMLFYLLGLWNLLGWRWGWEVQRRAWPGLMMLVFTLPLQGSGGLSVVALVAAPLSEWIALVVAWLMSSFGIETLREGSRLLLPGAMLTVGLHCAGVQYFEVFGVLLLSLIGLKGIPAHPAIYFPAVLCLTIGANLIRVLFVALQVTLFGLKKDALLDQVAGIFFMLLILPVLWRWPTAAGGNKKSCNTNFHRTV